MLSHLENWNRCVWDWLSAGSRCQWILPFYTSFERRFEIPVGNASFRSFKWLCVMLRNILCKEYAYLSDSQPQNIPPGIPIALKSVLVIIISAALEHTKLNWNTPSYGFWRHTIFEKFLKFDSFRMVQHFGCKYVVNQIAGIRNVVKAFDGHLWWTNTEFG